AGLDVDPLGAIVTHHEDEGTAIALDDGALGHDGTVGEPRGLESDVGIHPGAEQGTAASADAGVANIDDGAAGTRGAVHQGQDRRDPPLYRLPGCGRRRDRGLTASTNVGQVVLQHRGVDAQVYQVHDHADVL